MREIFTSGSVGRAPGNRCLYPDVGPGRIGAIFESIRWFNRLPFLKVFVVLFLAPQFTRSANKQGV